MPVIRVTTLVDAAPRTVAGVLRDAEALAAVRDRCPGPDAVRDIRITAPVRLLRAGDEVGLHRGERSVARLLVVRVGPDALVCRTPGLLEHRVVLSADGPATRMVADVEPTGDDPALAAVLRGLLATRAVVVAERAAALRTAPGVVATALVHGGRVLAAQRSRPPEHAGRWELPGGRVEPGETDPDAVVRECREELAADVEVEGRVGTDLPIAVGVLRVHRARLSPGAPGPRALEHSALRWVGADEVAGVDWLDADRAVVPDLVAELRRDG